MNWRKFMVGFIAVCVMLIISLILSRMFSGMAQQSEEKAREAVVLQVKAQKVEYTNNTARIIEMGRLSSQQMVDLSVEVQGQIFPGDVTLREGSQFKQGDLLISIFDEEEKNNLKARKSRFMNGIAGILPDIKIDFPESYEKYLAFFNDITIHEPLPELPAPDTEKEKVFLASRNILNDYYTIVSAEIRLSKFKLYAPFNGTYTNVYLQPGSVANPGSRIASIIRTDKLELEVPVRSEDAYWIKIGDEVKVSTKDMHTLWNGKVVRKSAFMDPASQTISVYVAVDHSAEKPLYAGQFLRAEFASKTLENTMEIPRNAVFNKNRVFTVEQGKLKENRVDILKSNETTVLFNGLPEGVLLVVEPLVNAKEGFNAQILN